MGYIFIAAASVKNLPGSLSESHLGPKWPNGVVRYGDKMLPSKACGHSFGAAQPEESPGAKAKYWCRYISLSSRYDRYVR